MDTSKVKKMPAARSLLFGSRLDREEIDKPLIAIVYSQNDLT
ncbi:MAG: hypothetical protein ACD_79C00435G0001, partial [uncultured bacterium]